MSATRHVLPAAAALALVVAGPPRALLELTHLPREVAACALGAALLLVLALATRAVTGPERPSRAIELAVLAVVASTLLSAVFSLSLAYAWRPALLTLAVAAIACGVMGREDRGLWLAWVGGAVTLLAALGLAEATGLVGFSPPGRAPSSLLGQRNTLAHVLVLGAPLTWWLASSASGARRGAWLAAAALIAAVVVMTRSRAAWLALPAAAVVFAIWSRRVVPVLCSVGGAAVAALAPVALMWRSASPYADTFRRLLEASGGSGAGRLEQYRRALQLWLEHPLLGVGPGNAWVALANEPNRFLNSDWVALLAERGALSVLCAAALGVFVLRAWRGRPEAPTVAAVLAGALITGALDAVLQLPAAAVLVAVVVFAGVSPRASAPMPRPAGLGGAALLAAGAIACGLVFSSRFISSGPSSTFDNLELALRLDPTDASTRLELTRAYVSARRCDDARRHLPSLDRDLPAHPGVRAVREAVEIFCGP